MAQLPPDGEWLVQQIYGMVVVFNQFSQEEIIRFDPRDANATAIAQGTIHQNALLTDEQKCFAHFWCGYFHGLALWMDR